MGPDPENRVGDQDTGSPSKPVSSGLHVLGEPGRYRERTRPHCSPSRSVFSSKVLQLHQQRYVVTCVDSLDLWKIINEEDAVLITKNRGEKFSSGFLHSGFFGVGGVSHYAATTFIVALSPGHSFVHSHQSRQEIIWIAPRKFQMLLRRLAPLTFLIRFQAFRDPLRGELPHVQILMNDGPNPLT